MTMTRYTPWLAFGAAAAIISLCVIFTLFSG